MDMQLVVGEKKRKNNKCNDKYRKYNSKATYIHRLILKVEIINDR